jgi:biopolymer transport protein ExbD
MKEQRITIEIDAEGKVSADAEGFSGDQCVQELSKLLAGLSAPRERVDRKPDTGTGVAARATHTVGTGKKP